MVDYTGRVDPEWKFGDQVGVRRFSQPSYKLIDKWKDDLKSDRNILLAYSYLDSLGPKLIKEMGYSYDDIKSNMDLPDADIRAKVIPWMAMTNVVEGFKNIKDVRRAAFDAMLEGTLLGEPELSKEAANEFIKRIVNGIIFPKVNQLTVEIDRLEAEVNLFKNKSDLYENKISAMENTLSWKITAPLRDSKILKGLISYFKK